MAQTDPAGTGGPIVSRFKIDLSEEAHRFVRQRFRVAGTGLVLGLAFIAVGIYGVSVLVSSGVTASYAIALLLIILGGAIAYVSVSSGLINPVTAVRGNASGITFERRWGGARSWGWKDPGLRIDIDDRSADPTANEEARGRLFFEAPRGVYGNLTRASIEPLLDTARTYGAVVSTKQLEQRDRGAFRLVRRIRIRSAPSQ